VVARAESHDGTRLRFYPRLREGVVVSRPNRFVMMVRTGGRTYRCHCPTTGRIGDLKVEGLRCLLSRGTGKGRKTAYTVEAVSPGASAGRGGDWIGINQTAANRYVHHFLANGQLSSMASGEVCREVRIGHSRIDFKVGDSLLEIKTPLITLDSRGGPTVGHSKFDSFDRLIRHFSELSAYVGGGRRALIALCYLYDAPPFRRPPRDSSNSKIADAAEEAAEKGVESWQINMKIDESGVSLLDVFRLDQEAPDAGPPREGPARRHSH